MDADALNWCLENNTNRIGADVNSRISLFHGNVLQPLESNLVNSNPDEIMRKMTLEDNDGGLEESTKPVQSAISLKDVQLPARDIVCAFNYSCCCLHSRKELILYFKHVLNTVSRKGGIFLMDLYGGTSSEGVLRLQRRFPNFTVCDYQVTMLYYCFHCFSMWMQIYFFYGILKKEQFMPHSLLSCFFSDKNADVELFINQLGCRMTCSKYFINLFLSHFGSQLYVNLSRSVIMSC